MSLQPLPSLLTVLTLSFSASTVAGAQADTLSPNDWRRALVGSWLVDFRLDSVRGKDGRLSSWRQSAGQPATGELRILDVSGIPSRRTLASELTVDFQKSWGRPMSCYTPGFGSLEAEHQEGTVRLWFTPGVADCGFRAEVKIHADSMVGTWGELSLEGTVAMGRIFLRRKGEA